MTPKYYDAHTHVNFAAYDEDREEVIKRAHDAGVWMTTVGTQIDTSRDAVELAKKYNEGVYATVGIHPLHTTKSYHDPKELGGGEGFTTRGEIFDKKAYRALAEHPKVVAIGECGLDYYRLEGDTKDIQKKAFLEQIAFANELGKPLMIHVREAYEDTIEILKAEAKVPFNIHFFAGDWETAKKFLELGGTLSFTGVLTFTNDYDEVVKNAPLEQILSETDAPYVAPVPHRGKRNEPFYVIEAVERIKELRSESPERVEEQLLQNAFKLFGISAK